MSGFSELVKNFGKTRDYIRDFFIYGYMQRGDFSGKSSRTYDDEKRRTENWLGNCLTHDDSVRGRQISISVESGHIFENPLYQAYEAKSFTDNDIRLHFLLSDLLADGKPRSLREIVAELDAAYGIFFDEQTVRGKLKEYAQEGMIFTQKQGKTLIYRQSCDFLEDWLKKYPGLENALCFSSLDDVFGVIGYQILQKTGIKNNIFLRKHNYIVHTLEDEMLLILCEALAQKRRIKLRRISVRAKNTADGVYTESVVIPMQISTSVQTGRRYLVAFSPKMHHFQAIRLDTVQAVRLGTKEPEYDVFYQEFLQKSQHVFGVSYESGEKAQKTEPLSVTIAYDPETEAHIPVRLFREKRIGIVQKEPFLSENGKKLLTVTIDAADPNECMQWVKSFIGRIVAVRGGTSALRRRFISDIQRMNRMYGGEENDAVS